MNCCSAPFPEFVFPPVNRREQERALKGFLAVEFHQGCSLDDHPHSLRYYLSEFHIRGFIGSKKIDHEVYKDIKKMFRSAKKEIQRNYELSAKEKDELLTRIALYKSLLKAVDSKPHHQAIAKLRALSKSVISVDELDLLKWLLEDGLRLAFFENRLADLYSRYLSEVTEALEAAKFEFELSDEILELFAQLESEISALEIFAEALPDT